LARPSPSSTRFPYTTLFRSPLGAGLTRRAALQDRTFTNRTACEARPPMSTDLVILLLLLLAVVVMFALGRPRMDVVALMAMTVRSEEHTSELQSRENLVCRL